MIDEEAPNDEGHDAKIDVAGDEIFEDISLICGEAAGTTIPPVGEAYLDIVTNRRTLREWWHEVMGNYGRYACYAMFLVLPSDEEVIQYLTKYGKELDVISGENCLIIALSKDAFKLSSFDEPPWSFNEPRWKTLVEEHSGEGYSVKVARYFGIDLTEFPCLLMFRDIRSTDHVAVTLKELTVKEIAGKMRAIFAAIQKAVRNHTDPLAVIQSYQTGGTFQKTGQKAVGIIGSFAGKTLEAVMKALIEATIK